MFAQYALSTFGNILLLLILARGTLAGLFRRYPAFYCYVGFSLIVSFCQLLIGVVYEFDSSAYYWAWQIPNLASAVFLLLVLWEIWRYVEATNPRKKQILLSFALAGGTTAIVATRLESTTGDPYFHLQAAALFAHMLACILVYSRICARRDVILGRNLRGMLVGVSLLVGFQGVNFARLLFVGSPFEVFAFFLQFFYFLALSVFAYSLWNYEPAIQLNTDFQERIEKVGEDLEKAIRILVSPR
ncbi:MAG TPA: hypothetical protein PLP42_04785 [Acidobacteriota bacterium]|nr:hypothetical protein [Acidobacteriota bacterium]